MLLHVLLKSIVLLRQLETNWRKSELPLKSFPHPIGYHTKYFLPSKIFQKRIPIPVELILANPLEIILI